MDGILYTKNGKELVACPHAKGGNIAVAPGTERIGGVAFYCNDNLLSGSHIWCAADNLAWCLASQVNGSHVQVVGVGMSLTGEHLTDK